MKATLPVLPALAFLLSACAPESAPESIPPEASSPLAVHAARLENCTTASVSAVAPGGGSGYPAPTSLPVTAGKDYRVTVSGTYFANDGLYADAKYSSRHGSAWSDVVQNYESRGPTLLEMQVWDPGTASYVSPDWGAYTTDHTYSTQWTAPADSLSFRINDFYAGNNSGGLQVTVCELPPPCTSFDVSAVAPGGGSGYPAPVTIPALVGGHYQVTVSGTYFANDGIYADAKYSSRHGSAWSDVVQNYESHGPTLLEMQVWDPGTASYVSPDWGAYAADHTYSTQWIASADSLSFRINDFYAGNDSGGLQVTVCELRQ
jgi:hypothetical protein